MGYGLILKGGWGEEANGADSKMNHETCQWLSELQQDFFKNCYVFVMLRAVRHLFHGWQRLFDSIK